MFTGRLLLCVFTYSVQSYLSLMFVCMYFAILTKRQSNSFYHINPTTSTFIQMFLYLLSTVFESNKRPVNAFRYLQAALTTLSEALKRYSSCKRLSKHCECV